jgi:hypothetical protein
MLGCRRRGLVHHNCSCTSKDATRSCIHAPQVYKLRLGLPVTLVACGALHTLAALCGGGLMGWGDNASGQATGRPGVPAVRPVIFF